MNHPLHGTAVIAASAALSAGCETGVSAVQSSSRTAAPKPGEEQLVDRNIATFDDLDFNVFSGARWGDFHKSHSQDVVVHWPDGHITKELDKHIEDMKAMFVWAPDTRNKTRPIKVGQKDGPMDEEYLFWDNQEFMKEIGLGQ